MGQDLDSLLSPLCDTKMAEECISGSSRTSQSETLIGQRRPKLLGQAVLLAGHSKLSRGTFNLHC